jgi:quercetin dioxygenase-like cupin family protein
MSQQTNAPIISRQQDAKTLHAFGDTMTLLLSGEQTNNLFSLWIETVPPGGGPPPHWHKNEDEWFVVQEGEFSFLLDGHWNALKPGDAAFMPRNALHTFKNTGTAPGKLLITTSPSGFETFFNRCANEFAKEGEPDMSRIIAIAGEHGIEFAQPDSGPH